MPRDTACAERLEAPLLEAGSQAAGALARGFGLALGEAHGYRHDLIAAITANTGDPDVDVAERCAGRTPLGIGAPIHARRVFATAPPSEAALAPKQHYETNLVRSWAHACFEEHREAPITELQRLVRVGFLENLGQPWGAVAQRWPNAVCTRLACLVKAAGETTKDMRRSGVNGLAMTVCARRPGGPRGAEGGLQRRLPHTGHLQ